MTCGAITWFQGAARADEVYPAPDGGDAVKITEQVRRGRRARDAGKWVEAEAAYKAAFDATDATSTTEAQRAEIAGELKIGPGGKGGATQDLQDTNHGADGISVEKYLVPQ